MTTLTLSSQQCRQARLAKDPRFDGRFFTGVHSTKIYCRSVCPVHPPLEKNVSYFATPAEAEQAGLRPCLRCRPELAPPGADWRKHQPRLSRAVTLLHSHDVTSVRELAQACYLSERQLRRLFQQHLGVSPLQALQTHRLLQAKQLLTDSSLTITEVAYASGYQSVRRFNDAFVQHYRLAPSRFRQQTDVSESSALVLRLPFRRPFDYQNLLGFFEARAIDGVEWVEDGRFHKRLSPSQNMMVEMGEQQLLVTLTGVAPQHLPDYRLRLRRMWDLDADPLIIATDLNKQPSMAALVEAYPGLRLAAYWDGWEALLRAILGQQVTIEAGRKLLSKLVAIHTDAGGFGLPSPQQLLSLDIAPLGIPGSRKQTLYRVAAAAVDWDLHRWPDVERLSEPLLAVKGVGPWTVAYWRLRSGMDSDSLPSGDVVLRKAAAQQGLANDAAELEVVAQLWRPWRSYATNLLWRSTVEGNDVL
ncbi:DNA-3-methyladenine glycosylase 2 family protein [Ferrimonas lipolytica]|uniref:DNA-3-methyladenine glycosylase II n=1 Tax=Ferrimonas lipolytica TaxID=2724191 RepID=A0A6H1UAR7_9GAMM|nr:Ada metal-binding domain-containing protein [Ferrimonas lipolytica]QIZ76134.1 DNA-3-methyladenine glycosylase 2 family protein [Ferrimonas lipolytica]